MPYGKAEFYHWSGIAGDRAFKLSPDAVAALRARHAAGEQITVVRPGADGTWPTRTVEG